MFGTPVEEDIQTELTATSVGLNQSREEHGGDDDDMLGEDPEPHQEEDHQLEHNPHIRSSSRVAAAASMLNNLVDDFEPWKKPTPTAPPSPILEIVVVVALGAPIYVEPRLALVVETAASWSNSGIS